MTEWTQPRKQVSRRSLLRGAMAASVLSGLTGPATARTGENTRRTRNRRRDTDRSLGSGAICEVDLDGVFQTEMHLSTDPADGDRERVLRVTSNGERTRDYGCSVISLTERDISLGEMIDNRTVYDYYEGQRNARGAPDESFVIVQDEDGVFVSYQHRDYGSKGEWQTHDLGSSIAGNGPQWRTKRLSSEDLGFQENIDVATVDFSGSDVNFARRAIEQALGFLRDLKSGTEISNPVEEYGRDARLLGVGIGKGWITQKTVNDVFYDRLRMGTDDGTLELEWPAAVSMSFGFQRDRLPQSQSQVEAQLSFNRREPGLSLSDLDTETVALTPYTSIIPLKGVDAVRPIQMNVNDSNGELVFDRRNIVDMIGKGETTLLLIGEFVEDAVSRPVSFFGSDSLRIE